MKKTILNHKTIFNTDFNVEKEDLKFKYQEQLTNKLDSNTTDFDQNILNEIVLWKVNRYASFDDETIALINSIKKEDSKINIELTSNILTKLLKTKGVQLAMASTILRFKNPEIYQIIDQRVYRIIYENQELKLNTFLNEKNINARIELYYKYLIDLRLVCDKLSIPLDRKSTRLNSSH